MLIANHAGLSLVGGLGSKQLTLSQPGGQVILTTVLRAPPPRIFRPCDGPVQKSIEHFVFRPKMVIFWRAGMTVFRLFYEMKLQTSKFKVLPF